MICRVTVVLAEQPAQSSPPLDWALLNGGWAKPASAGQALMRLQLMIIGDREGERVVQVMVHRYDHHL
jgi:hypothetical protein